MNVPRSPSWESIEQMEQARWRRFAELHQDDDELCAVIANARWDGARITQPQAVALAKIARDNGWSLPAAGRPAARGRRRRR